VLIEDAPHEFVDGETEPLRLGAQEVILGHREANLALDVLRLALACHGRSVHPTYIHYK
jgi:hypothetical protein